MDWIGCLVACGRTEDDAKEQKIDGASAA